MPAQAPGGSTTPVMGIRKGVTVSTVIALFVALGELDRLSGEVLDDQARSWPFTRLMGPGRLGALVDVGDWVDAMSAGWTATFPAYASERVTWLWTYLALDVPLIAVYGIVVASWLASRNHRPVACSLRALMVVDLLEDAAAFVASLRSGSEATAAGVVASGFSALKWLAVLVVLAIVGYAALQPGTRQQVGVWFRAFYTQRFSILAVLPIALLSIPAGSDLLDQLPDVQRRWVEDAQGVRHFAAAVLVVAVVTVGVLVLGRLRSGAVWQRTDQSVADEGRAKLSLGFIVPGVIAVALLVVWARGGGPPWQMPGLQGGRLLAFLAVPLLIMSLSGLIRWRIDAGSGWFSSHFVAKPHRVPSAEERVKVLIAGDILAAVAIVIAALGLIRSYTAVVALAVAGLGQTWWGLLPLAIGSTFAVLGWPVAHLVCLAVTDDGLAGVSREGRTWAQRVKATVTPTVPVPGNLGLRVGVLLTGIVLFFFVGAVPDALGSGIGVIATAMLALLAATLVVGGSVVLGQDRKAPELFWYKGLRLRALPVTTLLLLTLAFTSGIGSNVDIHGLRGLQIGNGTPLPVAERPDLATVVGDWMAATRGCGHTVRSGGVTYRLRPMFLLGAEGGGVRAAYWTAAGLDIFRGAVTPSAESVDWTRIAAPNRCASALFASGASGGAVGLTLARFAGAGLARDAATAIATPDALGAATSGLFGRDTAYAGTGVPFFGAPSFAAVRSGGPVWLDRAGLMESAWERSAGLGVPFLPGTANPATSAVTGALVLNSTRVADGCRMWVSQIRLATGDQASCDFSPTPAGHTVDLLAALGSGAGGTPAPRDRCLGTVSAATAAMLASRFPFVTPSGVAGPCSGQGEQQLVDGGYVENSGLGTVVDLAPGWLQEVRRRNGAALRSQAAQVDVIVPVVMYFDNGTGNDLVVDPPPPTSEVLVPLTTSGRAKGALVDTPALLRNSARLAAADGLFDPSVGAPADLVAQIEVWRPKPVVVVHQSTFPSVTAPLGWVLSEESMATMDRALAQQANPDRPDPAGPVASIVQNGSLRDAIRLARPDAP